MTSHHDTLAVRASSNRPLLPAPPALYSTRRGKLPYTHQNRVEYLGHDIPTQMSPTHYNNVKNLPQTERHVMGAAVALRDRGHSQKTVPVVSAAKHQVLQV